MDINLALTKQQAETILELADAALRGGGLKYAGQAVEIVNLINNAAYASAAAAPLPPAAVAVPYGETTQNGDPNA